MTATCSSPATSPSGAASEHCRQEVDEAVAEVVSAATPGTPTHRIRRSRWVAALVALFLVAAACTGGADDDRAALPTDAMELLRTAFENSATRSARGDMRMDMGGFVSASAQFESDNDQNMSMVMNLEWASYTDMPGFGFEMRWVDDVTYARYILSEEMQDLAGDVLPEGWLTLDSEFAAAAGIICPSPLPGITADDGLCRVPNDNLWMIEHVTDAEVIGGEVIDGVPMTQVRLTLDYGAAMDPYFDEPQDGNALTPYLGFMHIDEVAVDMWIDDNGLTRRMSMDLGSMMQDVVDGLVDDLDEADIEGDGSDLDEFLDLVVSNTSNVTEYFDYGADITIEAPSPDEIVGDFGDLMDPLLDAS